MLSREAWRLLEGNYERVLRRPLDVEGRAAMQLGACYAGMAIELSMLGATHACANPLTARYGTAHGVAIAVMLPHVVRWNASTVASEYDELLRVAGRSHPDGDPVDALASRLDELAVAGELPRALRALGAHARRSRRACARGRRTMDGQIQPAIVRRGGRAGGVRMRVLAGLCAGDARGRGARCNSRSAGAGDRRSRAWPQFRAHSPVERRLVVHPP